MTDNFELSDDLVAVLDLLRNSRTYSTGISVLTGSAVLSEEFRRLLDFLITNSGFYPGQ